MALSSATSARHQTGRCRLCKAYAYRSKAQLLPHDLPQSPSKSHPSQSTSWEKLWASYAVRLMRSEAFTSVSLQSNTKWIPKRLNFTNSRHHAWCSWRRRNLASLADSPQILCRSGLIGDSSSIPSLKNMHVYCHDKVVLTTMLDMLWNREHWKKYATYYLNSKINQPNLAHQLCAFYFLKQTD